jgi:hypothetical protein
MDYQGIALYGGPISVKKDGTHVGGLIMVPENIPHYYVETGDSNVSKLQVVAVGYDSRGNVPPLPDPQFRAPNFHSVPAPQSPAANSSASRGVALIEQGLALIKSGS